MDSALVRGHVGRTTTNSKAVEVALRQDWVVDVGPGCSTRSSAAEEVARVVLDIMLLLVRALVNHRRYVALEAVVVDRQSSA